MKSPAVAKAVKGNTPTNAGDCNGKLCDLKNGKPWHKEAKTYTVWL